MGLMTSITLLNDEHRYKYKFVFLEIGLLSTKFVKYCNYSVESLWLHVLVHVLVRWPILQKGSRIANKLGYTWLAYWGYVLHMLDVYWFFRLVVNMKRKNISMNKKRIEEINGSC